jgi:hypothetical protein
VVFLACGLVCAIAAGLFRFFNRTKKHVKSSLILAYIFLLVGLFVPERWQPDGGLVARVLLRIVVSGLK